MDEQLSLFEDPLAKEHDFEESLIPLLHHVLDDNFLDYADIMFEPTTDYPKNNGHISLKFTKPGAKRKATVFRFRFGKKVQWVAFRLVSRGHIPPELGKEQKLLEGEGYIRVTLKSLDELRDCRPVIAEALNTTIEMFPMEYSCCSRYQECSDAGRCVNPYREIASECRYRVNLKHGRNFYAAKDRDGQAQR